MRIKTVIFLLSLFTFSFIGKVYSQDWKDNYLTTFFKDKEVVDMVKSENLVWILCEDTLYSIVNSKVTKFMEINYKDGDVNLYKSKIYSKLIGGNSSVWVISENGTEFLRIEGDSKSDFIIEDVQGENLKLERGSIDSYDNLWLLYSVTANQIVNKDSAPILENLISSELEYKLFKFENGRFIEKPIYINDKYVLDFFIYQDSQFYLSTDFKTGLKLQKVNGDNIKEVILDANNNSLNYSHFIDDKIYFLSSNGYLYSVKNFNSVGKVNTGLKPNFTYNFTIIDDWVFVPSINGLMSYNLSSNQSKISSPLDFSENCFFGFGGLLEVSNNELVLKYGGARKYPCDSNNYGLAVYKLN